MAKYFQKREHLRSRLLQDYSSIISETDTGFEAATTFTDDTTSGGTSADSSSQSLSGDSFTFNEVAYIDRFVNIRLIIES